MVVFAVLLFLDPIPQDPAYHQFADRRTILGIPNFWDVISNAAISLAGIWSMLKFVKPPDGTFFLRIILILGMFLTGVGSGYYHWDPTNATLVWDRIPMIMVFIPFFSFLIYQLISPKWGLICLYALLPMGVLSVLYWYWSEIQGAGDLRFYAFMQFFPMLSIPFLLIFGRPGKIMLKYAILVLLGYTLAKVTEHYDEEIFAYTGLWSGHTLKHFLSGISLFFMGTLLQKT